MSARLALSAMPAHSEPSPAADAEAHSALAHDVLPTQDDVLPRAPAPRPKARSWVDPALLPSHAHPSPIGGSAPEWVKELNYNTLMHYGVGPQDAFGAQVGKALRFVDVSVQRRGNGERMEATTVAEVGVTKRASFCLRSASVPIHALSCIHDPAILTQETLTHADAITQTCSTAQGCCTAGASCTSSTSASVSLASCLTLCVSEC